MNDRGVAALVRRWVDLYTRGLPTEVRAARRDEVDDDLWCQQDEADARGRPSRDLAGEILVRLLLGMPSDLSWRVSQRRGVAAVRVHRSPSMPGRVIGALAVIGGASWGTLIFFTIFYTPGAEWVGASAGDAWLTVAGSVGLGGAIVGPAWLYQDRVGPQAGLAAASGGLGVVMVLLGTYLAFLVVPVASVIVVWEMARIGVLSRALAVAHALAAAVFLALVISSQIDYVATLSNHVLVASGVPYMVTWIVIGASFIRGVPEHEPAKEG